MLHRIRAVAGLAALALTAASLVACASSSVPSTSPGISSVEVADPSALVANPSALMLDPSAWEEADLFAVVTGNDVDALVGIDIASHTITRLAALRPNVAHLDVDGLVRAAPPVSVVLSDTSGSNLLVWMEAPGDDGVAIRELDRATGEVKVVEPPARGVLPFLYEGKLAWASAPGDGSQRLLSIDGSLNLDLPGIPSLIAAGPGQGRITVVVDPPNVRQRIFVIDVAKNHATELPTDHLVFGGIWADDTTLVASLYARAEPTAQDPQNLEPDNHLLTWSVDGGSNPEAVAGLVEGPTLATDFYPRAVAGGVGLIVAASELFDQPWVIGFVADSADPAVSVHLVPSGFVTAIAVSGTTVVVLQEGHVTFIDVMSGEETTVELGGVTETRWVGR